MSIHLTIDVATVREQIALLRGFLANPKLTARQRFLVTDLLRLLNQIEAAGVAETTLPDDVAPAPPVGTAPPEIEGQRGTRPS